jgi:Lon protease-like protein
MSDSPFKGSRRFGMCYSRGNGVAEWGTVLEIVQHSLLDSGCMLVLGRGRERFKVSRVIQVRPSAIISRS